MVMSWSVCMLVYRKIVWIYSRVIQFLCMVVVFTCLTLVSRFHELLNTELLTYSPVACLSSVPHEIYFSAWWTDDEFRDLQSFNSCRNSLLLVRQFFFQDLGSELFYKKWSRFPGIHKLGVKSFSQKHIADHLQMFLRCKLTIVYLGNLTQISCISRRV